MVFRKWSVSIVYKTIGLHYYDFVFKSIRHRIWKPNVDHYFLTKEKSIHLRTPRSKVNVSQSRYLIFKPMKCVPTEGKSLNAIEFLSAPCESLLILRYVSRNIYLRKTISTFNRYNICFRNYFAVELSKNNIFIILVEQLFMYHKKGCSLIFKGKLFYQMLLIQSGNLLTSNNNQIRTRKGGQRVYTVLKIYEYVFFNCRV